ncbi:MAG: NAD-dependent epimerase/dehydratase family protein [Candidatus Rokuibacteriota bacterium]
MSRRVAVTGASGFIGQNVVRYFRAAGWEVRAIVRPGRRCAMPDGVEMVTAPLVATDLTRAAAGSEVIVHAAGRVRAGTARQLHDVNVEGTRQVVEAATVLGARLVHISSQAAAGPGTPERPRSEDGPSRPLTAYGTSKLAAEEVVRSSRLRRWSIVRPALVYGPADRNALPLFRLAQRGIALKVGGISPAPAYTFVHVDDVARGIEVAATAAEAERQVFSLGHPQSETADTLADTLAQVLGRPCRRVRIPYALLLVAAVGGDVATLFGWPLAIDQARLTELTAEGWVCSVEKARGRLGFAARIGLREGFASTAAWYVQHGLLAQLPTVRR